jgi:ATP-dependent Clp protease protease subunit
VRKKIKTDESYYDIDVNVETLIENGMVEELFFLKDLKQRKLFLDSDIDQYSVGGIVRHIMQINKEDKDIEVSKRQPILLYVVSNGGEVDSGFELIDAIINSKTPVYTINLGYQYSMGFLIGIAGHKRFVSANAKFLMHDGSNFVYGSGSKVQDQMEFQRKVEERVKKYVISHSKITSDEYDSKLRVEWYMFADEAKEKGFVDYILGEDCDIDDIV